MFTIGTGFNGAETNCGIAHILGILADEQLRLLDISSNNNMPSVLFELEYRANFLGKYFGGGEGGRLGGLAVPTEEPVSRRATKISTFTCFYRLILTYAWYLTLIFPSFWYLSLISEPPGSHFYNIVMYSVVALIFAATFRKSGKAPFSAEIVILLLWQYYFTKITPFLGQNNSNLRWKKTAPKAKLLMSSVFTEWAAVTRASLDFVSSWWKPMDSVENGPTQSK